MPGVGGLVHGVEVESGLQLRLASRQEHDTRDGRGDTAAQHLQGVLRNLIGVGLHLAVSARGDHSRLEQDSLEHDLNEIKASFIYIWMGCCVLSFINQP